MSLNLEQVLGFKVRVTNILDVVTQGRIYSYNSTNNTLTLLVLKKPQQPHVFKIIKITFIKSLEVIGDKPLSSGMKRDPIKPVSVSIKRVENLLREKILQAREDDLIIGKGVTSEGQLVFNTLYKTVPETKWCGKSIVVLDEVEINPPYMIKNIKPLNAQDAKSLDLVQKIVGGAWKKMESERKGG